MGRWGVGSLLGAALLLLAGAAIAQETSASSSAAQDDKSTDRQGAVLFEEDPDYPKGRSIPGFVIWRTEPADASTKADIALRADVEIPDRVQINFTLPSNFPGGGIERVPGMLVKSSEKARGVAFASASAKISDSAFLIGLSNVDADRTRNLQLLRERAWIDMPIVYASKRRAILAIEQTSLRHKPLETAFGFWEQTSLAHAK
jgi:hypothetical protein